MRATRKKCGLPAEMRVPAEIRVTRRDAGTRSHAGKNPQKPETRTPVTRNYPKPDFSTRNPSLAGTLQDDRFDRCFFYQSPPLFVTLTHKLILLK